MDALKFSELFTKYYEAQASETELRDLRDALLDGTHDRQVEKLMKEKWNGLTQDESFFEDAARTRMLQQILQPQAKARKIYWISRAIAAAAVIILAVGSYYYFDKRSTNPPAIIAVANADIAPGHAGAIVTLSNGRKIALDTAKDGVIAMDGNVRVVKENGQIHYEGASNKIAYNETSTDRGRSWPVKLPDGSIAWLNTSSSIRYPISFTGKERRVEMAGECFFEVVHNNKMPFRVSLPNGETVEDVGTSFNIRAYKDEAVTRTTVTEGVANISTDYVKYIITAGRQAESGKNGVSRVSPVNNIDEITAWKDNRFRFRNASIQQILTEASRWYDMEVEFKNEIADTYTISMSRSVPLSKLLNDLEQSGGVHFSIKDKKVTVIR